jgi:hypothetical protein
MVKDVLDSKQAAVVYAGVGESTVAFLPSSASLDTWFFYRYFLLMIRIRLFQYRCQKM